MSTSLSWLKENAVALLTLAIVAWLVVALGRAMAASRRGETPGAAEDFSRTEKVRQQIRRKIAERKDAPKSAGEAVPPRTGGPLASGRVPPIDPFGGPARRGWARLRRWFGRSPSGGAPGGPRDRRGEG